MIRRVLAVAIVLAFSLPATAWATDGILLLTQSGSAAWNAEVADLAAKVNAEKPTELSLGPATRETVAPAVERLQKRGVTSITLVPLFGTSAVSAETLGQFAVPVRIASATPGAELLTALFVERAEALRSGPGKDTVVLMGFGAGPAGSEWRVDLSPVAQSLNRSRQFSSILEIKVLEPASALEQEQIRRSIERTAKPDGRILVLSLVTPSRVSEAIAQRMQGLNYQAAETGVITDPAIVSAVVKAASSAAVQ